METQEIKNYQVDRKYSVKFIKAAGVKTGAGYEVEVHGDNLNDVMNESATLKVHAEILTPASLEVKEGK
jgi:hypothetical protein